MRHFYGVQFLNNSVKSFVIFHLLVQSAEQTIFFYNFYITWTKHITTYRVSHETWQLVNGFECLLSYSILNIKDFFQFISLTNSYTQICFTLKSIFYKITAMLYFLLFPFVSKNLTNYGRRHLKLFTNCHVLWDTLYIIENKLLKFILKSHRFI